MSLLLRAGFLAQAPKNVPPCGKADTLLGLQEAKELGSTWGAGQRGVEAEFSQGRVRENRGPQQDCQQAAGSGATRGWGQGTRGGRLWEGNMPSVSWAPAPSTPPAQ